MFIGRDQFPDLFRSTALPFLEDVSFGKYKTFKPRWMEIFSQESTTRDLKQYTEVSGYGSFLPITEGGEVMDDAPVAGFKKTLDPVRYGRSGRVSKDVMEADQWDLMGKMARGLAQKGRIHQELLAAAVVNRAFSGSYNGPDGVPLCSLLHPLVKSGGYNANTMTAADLDQSSLQDALTAAEMQRNHEGDLIHVPWSKLLITPANRFNAQEITKSSLRSDTANNATNALKYAEDGVPEPLVWKYLAESMGGDDDTWFLLAPPDETGLKWLWRKKLYSDDWIEERTETGVYALRYKAVVDFVNHWGVFGVQGV